jgi:pyrroline-5-carboxylate reductase
MNTGLSSHQIGIIGCGQLGRALAAAFIDNGLPKENLLVSYGGNPATLEAIKKAGFGENIVANREIGSKATIIFSTVRPQSFQDLKKLDFPGSVMVVSCMAGISISSLKKMTGNVGADQLFRIMPSGPETIKAKKGIVAVYPPRQPLTGILSDLGFRVYGMPDEERMHLFTAGVCLPAAILAARRRNLPMDKAIHRISEEYPDFIDIYEWAIRVLPVFNSDHEQQEYLSGMITQGGVTEAIIDRIHSGDQFEAALKKGVARSRELAERALSLTIRISPV